MQTQYKGYLTVYLSLIFGIVLSLVLALVEGATITTSRAQSELVADLGLDSVFAEYNREVLNQYELFFIDTSYGQAEGGLGKLQEHLSDYMGYNMDPSKDNAFMGSTYLKLTNPHLNIDEASFATDDGGAVWKAQAVNYMKSVYGGDIIATVQANINTVEGNQLNTRDVQSEINEQKKAFEEILEQNEIIEYDSQNVDGISYTTISETLDYILGSGILALVMPDKESVSDASIDKSIYFSARQNAGTVNKGIGLHEGIESPDGIIDELIYGEYLMTMCGNHNDVKQDGVLDYQIEYILYGNDSDMTNLRACATALFGIRAASNMLYIMNDKIKVTEVKIPCVALCSLLGVPAAGEVLAGLVLGVWALAESVVDVKSLLSGERVPLLKDSKTWKLDLGSVFSKCFFGTNGCNKGLSYEDYLRVLLGLMNKDTKLSRSLDIVEMDIRNTQGNENFRIDRCVDYINVNFGFMDAHGHDFVFNKTMCYE